MYFPSIVKQLSLIFVTGGFRVPLRLVNLDPKTTRVSTGSWSWAILSMLPAVSAVFSLNRARLVEIVKHLRV